MALEIKELVVKFSVQEKQQNKKEGAVFTERELKKLKNTIVEDSVESVLEVLDRRLGR